MAGYKDFANYYDLLTDNVEYEKRAKYMDSLIFRSIGKREILLDLGCGTGSFSFLFEEMGYDVIGVDCSEEMLFEAQRKKYERKSDVLFIKQKIEELDLYGSVSAAVSTLDTFNHITRAETLKKAFLRISLFMDKGGIFVFDVNTPFKHREILGNNTFVYDYDDVYCVWQNETDKGLLTKINLDIFEKEKNGLYKKHTESFCERGYEIQRVKKWLCEAGFEVLDIFEENSELPLSEETQRAVFLAKKI